MRSLLLISFCILYCYAVPNLELTNILSLYETIPEPPKTFSGPFRNIFLQKDLHYQDNDDPGKPLFLTPLIKKNRTVEARKLARVQLGHRHGHSYAGYITVNENYDSNLFFWFFSARNDSVPGKAPLIVWLQGGPGGSSLFGLFTENGPYYIDEKMHINAREYPWNIDHNVLYIDNPVGTGFSFTNSDDGYAKTEIDVGIDLYNFLLQFYKVFPELEKRKLFITGESYAGKYVPALAYTIHKYNPTANFKMNLRGIAIGDGLCDPITMTDYGDFLYQVGLVDENGRNECSHYQKEVVDLINKRDYIGAFKKFDTLMNGDLITGPSLFKNLTGLDDYYNYVTQNKGLTNYWMDFINNASTRRQLHVGGNVFNSGLKVEQHLMGDIMKSVKPWIEELANHYSVLIYNGQLDVIIAYPLTENFVNSLKWKYSDKFAKAKRMLWMVDGEVAGYVKEAPNLAFVLVRNAGHLVPFDQPKFALDMISKFTKYS